MPTSDVAYRSGKKIRNSMNSEPKVTKIGRVNLFQERNAAK